jgi:hypothetical protein
MQAVCLQEVFRQPQARRRGAFRPDVREAVSSRHLAPALPSGPGRRYLALAILQPAERRDVRAALSRVPASWTVRVWLSGPEASPDELPVRQASERALPSGLALWWAQAVPQGPLTAPWLRDAEASAWWPDVPAPRAVVSVHAAAEPRPEAASAPWVQQAGAVAVEVSDASRAALPAASDVPVRQLAAARQADAVGRPSVAAQSGVREPQAAAELPGARRVAVPLALPSAAASVFRQGPSLAGPARPRAAARFAHAMRSLQIASRSEPSWRAARNEGWSCG